MGLVLISARQALNCNFAASQEALASEFRRVLTTLRSRDDFEYK